MKVRYKKSFIKDLNALKSTPAFARVRRLVFEEIPGCESLGQLSECKKLKSSENAYRLRVGDYRIGFFWEDGVIVFSRVLHRSKIYGVFPPS